MDLPALTERDRERFLSRIDRSGGPDACWPWTGGATPQGYGRINLQGSVFLASRVAWYLATGVDPRPLDVLHRCDSPPCLNPAHLFTGTRADNCNDMWEKGRGRIIHRRGELHGQSRLNDQSVLVIRHLRAEGVRVNRLAAAYLTSTSEISSICCGRSWSHVGGPRTRGMRAGKLTPHQVREIRSRLSTGKTQRDVATDFHISPSMVSRIATGNCWGCV